MQKKTKAEKEALYMAKKAYWFGMIVSDPTRRRILQELVHGTATAGVMAVTLGGSMTSVARPLRFLESQKAIVCTNPLDAMAFVRGQANYELSQVGLRAIEYMKQQG